MKRAIFWSTVVVAGAILITLVMQRYARRETGNRSIREAVRDAAAPVADKAIQEAGIVTRGTNLIAATPSDTEDASLDAEVAEVEAIGREYGALTEEAVRSNYRVVQETNQVPTVLDITAVDDQNGDQIVFSFDKSVLYQVSRIATNGSGYQMFLHNGRVLSYLEETKKSLTGLYCGFYTNGQLKAVLHYSNAMWLGPARFYDESGNLILSTNYTQPTLPIPPQRKSIR